MFHIEKTSMEQTLPTPPCTLDSPKNSNIDYFDIHRDCHDFPINTTRDNYTIRCLFRCLCDDKYNYCRKCIFTPLRQLDYKGDGKNVFDIVDECCLDCPGPKLEEEGIWFMTPPMSPPQFGNFRLEKDKDDYKNICTETRIIVDFCTWCSLNDIKRNKESINNFFETYKVGTVSHSMKQDVIYDMDDLGFFWKNFTLVDDDAEEYENFA